MIYHKKSLGQHFLNDQEILDNIVQASNVEKNSVVWEIGPGTGNLTNHILKTGVIPTCFEVDKDLWQFLENKYQDKINLVKKDILKVKWEEYFTNHNIKIIANLPYQITSPFLFKVIDHVEHFDQLVIMIQKEVANRIHSKTGSKEYGILSLKIQYYFNTEVLFYVSPDKFTPPPKVDSAVIRLIPRKNKPVINDLKLFWSIIETSFRNRRKMLRNNLKSFQYKIDFLTLDQQSPIDFSRRGETLSEEDFIILYNFLSLHIIR